MTTALQILGGLGVFLYGMRVMSSGLQKVAGDRLRAVLSGMTRNRVTGVFTGFFLTCAVQSSSATTVMIVSFANAGLLTLTQAIGLVMGANIGTTITAWLVAILGFKIKISAFALPIIGIGFPLSMLGSPRARNWSEVMIGFGLLFLGLQFLKSAVPGISPEHLAFLNQYADSGILSVLLFVLVGTIVTVIVQSSSATMAITIAMTAEGLISYEVAAAMVLGENLGTTITATLAAIGANRTAVRVARSHMLFNVVGVLLIIPLMGTFLGVVDSILPGDPLTDPMATPAHLALFHTTFNVSNMLLQIWFVPQIKRIVEWMVPLAADEDDAHLMFLETGLLATPELAVVEARRGLQKMVGVVRSMTGQLHNVIAHPHTRLGKLVDDIKRGEARTDEMEEELIDFCAQLARTGSSETVGQSVARMLEMANDIERMGDHCMNLVLLAERRYEKDYRFNDEAYKELDEMFSLVSEFLDLVEHGFDPKELVIVSEARVIEEKINKLRNRARKRHSKSMQEGEIRIRQGLLYLDMMTNLEKLGDYANNVASASAGISPHPRLSAPH